MILDRILESKQAEVESRRLVRSLEEVRSAAAAAPPARDFAAALRRNASGMPAVIAEVKKASPSKGVIRSDFDPEAIASAYQCGGASAISVLTDEQYFLGSLDYLMRVRARVDLPVLRKDFLIDEYQVFEARAAGADAVLLIAAALDEQTLARLMTAAAGVGMACLVEVHDEDELSVAVGSGSGLIGINNRNLYTFEVNLETTAKLMQSLGSMVCERHITVVSESGIFTKQDVRALGEMGVDAVLIGEALVREHDIEAALKELLT